MVPEAGISGMEPAQTAQVRAKEQRAVIDQAAAVAILQGWLDERRPVSGPEEVDE